VDRLYGVQKNLNATYLWSVVNLWWFCLPNQRDCIISY